MKLYKYEFTSEKAFNTQLNKLKIEVEGQTDESDFYVYKNVKAIIELGKIMLEHGEYDSDGEEIKAPVLSEKYCVDIIWKDDKQADNFVKYEVVPNSPKNKIFGW